MQYQTNRLKVLLVGKGIKQHERHGGEGIK